MKNRNPRVWVLLVGFLVGIGCLGAIAQNDARPTVAANGKSGSTQDDDWVHHVDDLDDEHAEEFDEERELEWEFAEQSLLASSIECAADVAKDETKTAVATSMFLMEHADPSVTIDTLTLAIEQTNSPAIKRALQLKLAEVHLENDDESSAIAVAMRLLVAD